MKHFRIGVELYTLREELNQDFKSVFRDLSKLGIDLVEPAFCYGGMEPEEYRAFLKELNLSVRSIYAPQVSDLLTADSEAARFATELNVPYLTVGSGLDFEAKWLRLARELRAAVAANLAMGRKTLYHNHHHQFAKNEKEMILDAINRFGDEKVSVIKKVMPDYVKYESIRAVILERYIS